MPTQPSIQEYEYLQAKYEKLLNAVCKMRHHQMEWDRWHASSDRERKRIWEREVDRQLKEEAKQRKSQQAKIFTNNKH